MIKKYFETINKCRICFSQQFKEILNLGQQPPANSIYKENSSPPNPVPLRLMFCQKCHTVQLGETVDPSYLFDKYVWVTGTSKAAKDHSQLFFNEVINKTKKKNPFVIEIASNDGTFLKVFKENNCKILGVDPAKNIADFATKNGIPTLPVFFNKEVALDLVKKNGYPDVVFARNVIPHVKEIHSVIEGITELLDKDGIGVIEFHDAKIILEELHYDSIYHEHLFYFSLKTISYLLNIYKLDVFDIAVSPISGGSWIIYFSKKTKEKTDCLKNALKNEEKLGINDYNCWKIFGERAIKHSKNLFKTVNKHDKIIAYGASARSSTLLNFCNISNKQVNYIIDKNIMKQGLLAPGSNIKIISLIDAQKNFDNIDVLLLLAWNFEKEIVEEIKALGFKGKIIIPLPFEIRVI